MSNAFSRPALRVDDAVTPTRRLAAGATELVWADRHSWLIVEAGELRCAHPTTSMHELPAPAPSRLSEGAAMQIGSQGWLQLSSPAGRSAEWRLAAPQRRSSKQTIDRAVDALTDSLSRTFARLRPRRSQPSH